ncbi:MAG TPA: hypothetical protein VF715_02755 [Thermoleophilaceae bacterium]
MNGPTAGAPASRTLPPEDLLPAGPQFVRRDWILDRLGGWLGGGERVFLLTGDAGTGKSVFSAWVGGAPGDGDAPPELDRARAAWSAAYFCSERYVGSSTDPRAFVRSLSQQLSSTLPGFEDQLAELQRPLLQANVSVGVARGEVIGNRVNQLVFSGSTVEEMFETALREPLRATLAGAAAPEVLILVDGLDEALGEAGPTIADLVADLVRVPGPLRFLLTSENDPSILARLGEVSNASMLHVDLSSPEAAPRVNEDIERYVRGFAEAEGLSVATLRSVRAAAMGNFVYAQGFVEQLGEPDADGLAPDLSRQQEYRLKRVLERGPAGDWRAEWRDSLEPLLGVLAVVAEPVPLDALAGWIGTTPVAARMLGARLGQLVRTQGELIGLSSPAFASFLLSPTLPGQAANPFEVDAAAAHERIARHCVDCIVRDGWGGCGDYGLVHLPEHVEALYADGAGAGGGGGGGAAREPELLEHVVQAMQDPSFASELRKRVPDPITAGRPYRRLLALLLQLGRLDLFERFVDDVADAGEPALRATALEALIGLAERDGEGARGQIERLALSGRPTRRLVALRATVRLSHEDQARVFRAVVDHGDHEARMAAAYAIWVNWADEPARLAGAVLNDLVDTLSFARPRRSRAMLEFLANTTITNYINNCWNAEVANLTSELWHRVLVEKLHVNLLNRSLLERTLISPAMARHFSTRVLGAAREFDAAMESQLFPLRGDDADAVREVAARLDPAADLLAVEEQLARLLDSEVVLLRILAAEVLAVHASTRYPEVGPMVERLFDAGSPRRRATVLIAHGVALPDSPPAWLPALERMTRALIEAPGETVEQSKADPLLSRLDLLFVPLGLAYGRAGQPMKLHETVIADAALHPDVRRSCLTGTGVVGLYHPDLALAALQPAVAADERFLSEPGAVDALGLVASLHRVSVDVWLADWGAASLRERVLAATQVETAHRYVEAVGLYTNGVHQAIHYPFMRTTLLMQVFTLLLDTDSPKEWAHRYSSIVLRALRESDYTLIEWTR